MVSEDKRSDGKSNASYLSSSTSQHRLSTNYDPLSQMSSSLMTNENTVDAASEKDLVEYTFL